MTILADVVKELIGMFVADARLSIAVLALVSLVAVLTTVVSIPQLVDGALLLVGCLAVLVESATRDKRRRARD